jgi:hypothetical protein
MKVNTALLVIFALAISGGKARADWQYVKWGMTAEQVVAASKGEAKLNSGDGRNIVCAFTDQNPVAYIARKKIDSMEFDVVICAGGDRRVSSVVLSPKPSDNTFNPLRAALLGRYGQPIEEKRGDIGTVTWRDTKGGNLVRLIRVIDTARIEYRKATSGL